MNMEDMTTLKNKEGKLQHSWRSWIHFVNSPKCKEMLAPMRTDTGITIKPGTHYSFFSGNTAGSMKNKMTAPLGAAVLTI